VPSVTLTLSDITARSGAGIPLGVDPACVHDLTFLGVTTLELAGNTDLCFAEASDQAERVAASAAGAVLVTHDFPMLQGGPMLLRVDDPRRVFFALAALFAAAPVAGVHPSAQIHDSARIGHGVALGACAVIDADTEIGDGCAIGPGCWIGPGVRLGPGSVLEANVSVHAGSSIGARCVIHSGAVIGSDGFGFQWDGSGHRKVPQLGRVVIEDDVDIGCNSCVDRATLGETRVRRGARIDNLVQVAHNCDIGEHVILVSQAGVAGSSSLGTGVVVAGQVAISDHVHVGEGARIGGQAGVTKDVPRGAVLFGTPARAMSDTLRELAALARLPEALRTLRRQHQRIAELERRLAIRDDADDPGTGA
jgi:UDP-3-O-[3-hydroxymyristoyl] glucosamine N-acyltransferase